ncbi:MAG: hypothetical protein H6Q68_105 [Firmicutes bacterium]|nr:hypothetical protein [Bacillota bacterium]
MAKWITFALADTLDEEIPIKIYFKLRKFNSDASIVDVALCNDKNLLF